MIEEMSDYFLSKSFTSSRLLDFFLNSLQTEVNSSPRQSPELDRKAVEKQISTAFLVNDIAVDASHCVSTDIMNVKTITHALNHKLLNTILRLQI